MTDHTFNYLHPADTSPPATVTSEPADSVAVPSQPDTGVPAQTSAADRVADLQRQQSDLEQQIAQAQAQADQEAQQARVSSAPESHGFDLHAALAYVFDDSRGGNLADRARRVAAAIEDKFPGASKAGHEQFGP